SRLLRASKAVLRAEDRDELHAFNPCDEIDDARERAIDAGVIRHDADATISERAETVGREHIEPRAEPFGRTGAGGDERRRDDEHGDEDGRLRDRGKAHGARFAKRGRWNRDRKRRDHHTSPPVHSPNARYNPNVRPPALPVPPGIADRSGAFMKTFYLIDGHSQIFRAYYAPFGQLTSPTGEPTKAVYVFTQMLLAILDEKKPDYLAVTLDFGDETTHRRSIFPEYKAHRDVSPEDFSPQVDRIVEILSSMGIPVWQIP